MSQDDEVILEIEGTPIKCNKKDLIEHSDYFKAMFEGNFTERNQSSIKLEGIDLKSMNIILTLLWDQEYIVDNEEILVVLQTACILQFVHLRDCLIDKLTEILAPNNCIKIWYMAESLDLKPLYLKAKNIALMEFSVIKDTDCFLELNLKQLFSYLANIYLICDNEMDVFNTLMKWYYENGRKDHKVPSTEDNFQTDILICLISCLDFNKLSDSNIKEIMMFPDISDNRFMLNVLNCLLDKRLNIDLTDKFNDSVIKQANKLVSCLKRSEHLQMDPLFLITKDLKYKEASDMEICYTHDMYKRRRIYIKLDRKEVNNTTSLNSSKSIVLYDKHKNIFLSCLDVTEEKYKGLEGFHLVGYKELIFMFGGEVSLGRGNWNLNFWVYDTIRERWERKTKMPFGRRHFNTCIAGNYLYIIGGTGSFRIIQENMYWYNYKENIWSLQLLLLCPGMQVKCCDYKNQLFLLNINNKCGYIFDHEISNFHKLNIMDENQLVTTFPDQFTLFSYDGSIFIKGPGCILIEMKVINQQLHVLKYQFIKPINCDNMESVLCNDVLYTLYKYNETRSITLESLSLKTCEINYIFKNLPEDALVDIDGSKYKFGTTCKLFALQQHYKTSQDDIYINEFII